MCPARVLLANEFGAGRGHLVTLRDVAKTLGPQFTYDAALCQRLHDTVLQAVGAEIYDGPALRYDISARTGPTAIPTSTWGEFLGDLGLSDPDRVAQIIAWWRHVMITRNIALAVCDYAPLALLAARSLEIPTVSVGQGYGLPPWQMPCFPLFDPLVTAKVHDEAVLLGNLNAAIMPYGMAPLQALPEIYRADLTLVTTLPMLDLYASWRQTPYFPPAADLSADISSDGTEVFVYFSQRELADRNILDALLHLPLPRRGYLPNLAPDVADALRASGMILEVAPVSVDLIARRSRILFNAGQHGILSLALLAGLAQVCVPQHMEQTWHATAAQRAGVARLVPKSAWSAKTLIATLEQTYHDAKMAQKVRQTANQLRADLMSTGPEALAQALGEIARQAV